MCRTAARRFPALEPQARHRCKLIGRAEVIGLRAGDLGIDRSVSIPHGVLLAGRCQQLDPYSRTLTRSEKDGSPSTSVWSTSEESTSVSSASNASRSHSRRRPSDSTESR
jgi:hypothetical protein